ncbi:hypothetical protein GW17_00021245 [Ensete ventricosum]|nr:hypothetical protein GW17_00021245 [Ensete ventricosum]
MGWSLHCSVHLHEKKEGGLTELGFSAMGGICAKISAVDSSPDEITIDGNGFGDCFSMAHESYGKSQSIYKTMPLEETVEKQSREGTFSRVDMSDLGRIETVPAKQQLCKTSSHKSKSTGSESTASGNSGMTKASVFSVVLICEYEGILCHVAASSIFRFDSELTPPKQMRERALGAMQYLMTLVRYTAVSILP